MKGYDHLLLSMIKIKMSKIFHFYYKEVSFATRIFKFHIKESKHTHGDGWRFMQIMRCNIRWIALSTPHIKWKCFVYFSSKHKKNVLNKFYKQRRKLFWEWKINKFCSHTQQKQEVNFKWVFHCSLLRKVFHFDVLHFIVKIKK